MCGIAGILDFSGLSGWEDSIGRMTETLVHRGPDDHGVWIDQRANIALGHRRLSIIDLSPEGRQPMVSHSGRYVMVFNGEIYNYRDLRADLPDSPFRGSSDTEVMLAAFDRWGIGASLARFNGMFAFAVWDRQDRMLTLARDRAGEKPLYYCWTGGSFLFGSELKALRAHPAFTGQISRDSLALFMRHSYVPAPYTIYQNVWKLPPATTLTVGRDQFAEPLPYWSLREVAEAGAANPFRLTEAEAVAQLDALLSDSVKLRMVADVPLGAMLSGGVDSSTVVALMQRNSTRPVKTFTLGFHVAGYDEAGHAKEVARHLGCDHTELYVTPQDAMDVIPGLPAIYDEPFADSSQIPTYLVSRLARRHVTVSVSGDGGDEMFGGYTRYQWGDPIWRRMRRIPLALRRNLAGCLNGLPHGTWDKALRITSWLPKRFRQSKPADKLQKLANFLPAENPENLYLSLVSQWHDPTSLVRDSTEPPTALTQPAQWAALPDFTRRMMFLDTLTYLPDDILVKLDRASMAVSLESRVPILDHRIIEFSWRLPLGLKVRGGETKWLLRRVLDQYVPRELTERPKSGFGLPIHEWLRGALREWAEEYLDAGRLSREGFFEPAPIRQQWVEHLSGRRNHMFPLWNVLMFRAWLDEQGSRCSEPADVSAVQLT
jgi:asparagine synthase (glutamine-hydrolysing)